MDPREQTRTVRFDLRNREARTHTYQTNSRAKPLNDTTAAAQTSRQGSANHRHIAPATGRNYHHIPPHLGARMARNNPSSPVHTTRPYSAPVASGSAPKNRSAPGGTIQAIHRRGILDRFASHPSPPPSSANSDISTESEDVFEDARSETSFYDDAEELDYPTRFEDDWRNAGFIVAAVGLLDFMFLISFTWGLCEIVLKDLLLHSVIYSLSWIRREVVGLYEVATLGFRRRERPPRTRKQTPLMQRRPGSVENMPTNMFNYANIYERPTPVPEHGNCGLYSTTMLTCHNAGAALISLSASAVSTIARLPVDATRGLSRFLLTAVRNSTDALSSPVHALRATISAFISSCFASTAATLNLAYSTIIKAQSHLPHPDDYPPPRETVESILDFAYSACLKAYSYLPHPRDFETTESAPHAPIPASSPQAATVPAPTLTPAPALSPATVPVPVPGPSTAASTTVGPKRRRRGPMQLEQPKPKVQRWQPRRALRRPPRTSLQERGPGYRGPRDGIPHAGPSTEAQEREEEAPKIEIQFRTASNRGNHPLAVEQDFRYGEYNVGEPRDEDREEMLREVYDHPVPGAAVKEVVHRMYWKGRKEEVARVLKTALETTLLTSLTLSNCQISMEDLIWILSVTSFSLETLEVRDAVCIDDAVHTPLFTPRQWDSLEGAIRARELKSLTITSHVILDSLFVDLYLPKLAALSLRLLGDANLTRFDHLLQNVLKHAYQSLKLRGDLAAASLFSLRERLNGLGVAFDYGRIQQIPVVSSQSLNM